MPRKRIPNFNFNSVTINGHQYYQVTMDIYAKAKYNRPAELSEVVNGALNASNDSDES